MNTPSRSVARERALALATLLLVSLIAAGPLWGLGLLNTRAGGDSPFLLLRTHQLVANLRAGTFPVRWMPDAAYGLGYPFFSYYAALPYYLAASFTIIGLDILTAIKLTQTLFFAAAALSMYGWGERIFRSRLGAWVAAVAYTAAPFHLVNVYVRGDSLSEFAAFAFYPLILWGLDRLASSSSIRRVPLPALAYAGLILTHNVSALIFSPFILLYVAFLALRCTQHNPGHAFRRLLHSLSVLIATLLLALLLSAGFWLPALAETKYVQLDVQTTGYFFYGNHFRAGDLIQWHPLFGYETTPGHPSPFAMGAVQAVLALVGVCVTIVTPVRPRTAERDGMGVLPASPLRTHTPDIGRLGSYFAVLSLLLSTWLITPMSRPLWEHLPLLPLVQFPWRFLSVQALCTALLTGALVMPLRRRWGLPVAWILAAALGALVMTTSLVGLQPEYLPIRADEVTAERIQLYELFTGNIGSTIRHEYLPRWVEPRPYAGPSHVTPHAAPRAMVVSGALSRAERVEHGPTRRVWEVEVGSAGVEVAFPIFYWPGWRATVDDAAVGVKPAPGSGYLSLAVPAGTHIVEIWLGRTPLRMGAEVASLAGALSLSVLWVVAWRQARGEGRERQRGRELRLGQCVICTLPFVVVLALLIALRPRVPPEAAGDLTMDFERMPYLHHNPDGIAFDDRRMVGYTISAQEIAPGETVRVTLEWQRNEGASGDHLLEDPPALRLVSPAAVRQTSIPAVAEASLDLGWEQGSSAGRTTLELFVPQATAPGLHLLQIASRPRTYLQPVWIGGGESAEEQPSGTAFADGRIRLHAIHATQPTPEGLDVQLDWSTSERVAGNYGLSLSLKDPGGNEWLHQGGKPGYDTQPGRGFLPTSLWPTGQLIPDRHTPGLQPGAPPGDNYTLTVDLYRVATWTSVGAVTKTVSLKEATVRPDAPILAQLLEEVALSRLDAPGEVLQGEGLQATAYWLEVDRPTRDYLAEWTLGMPGGEIIAYTGTQPLAPGSSPTDWPSGAWVAGRAALSVPPTAPPGEYTLSLSLRDPESGAVLGTYTHPETVWVRERERVWELPEMERESGARFGGMVELLGYDLSQEREGLELTLHWRALSTPDQHYMLFVHLADPDSGRPVVQVDSMPREFTYPTGMWAPGEIISDEVSLSLEDVASGQYDLAVGWYDPQTRDRLLAVDAQGVPLPENRLLLPGGVTLP